MRTDSFVGKLACQFPVHTYSLWVGLLGRYDLGLQISSSLLPACENFISGRKQKGLVSPGVQREGPVSLLWALGIFRILSEEENV